MEPLIESICRKRDRTAEEIRPTAIDDLHHYIGEQKVFDDILNSLNYSYESFPNFGLSIGN